MLGLVFSTSSASAASDRFPGAAWETRTPGELGLDGAKLEAIAELTGGSGVVVYDGYIVKSWGAIDEPLDWASAAKPVIGTMLLFAVDEGLLSDVDALIAEAGWELIPEDQPMTYRHLVNMVSGYTRAEDPGAAWSYNDYGIMLLARTLFDEIYGAWPDDVAQHPARLGALGIEDGTIFGSREGYGVLASVRDYARISWFWLQRGRWHEQQLLPADLLAQNVRPHVPFDLPLTSSSHPEGDYLGVGTFGGESDQTAHGPGIYGFGYWFNADGPEHAGSPMWPDAPLTAYQANGHWGQEVATMLPGHGVVLVHRDGSGVGFEPGSASSAANQSLKLLIEAIDPWVGLRLDKSGSNIVVEWESDCATSQFALYEGVLGQWNSHLPVACSDAGGDGVESVTPGAGNRYYLVVPWAPGVEGSYGRDSFHDERQRSTAPCASSQDLSICG